jgi:hypothetical protein
VPDSITPRKPDSPEIRYQPPSFLSLRSAATTVPPDGQQRQGDPNAPRPGASRRKLWFFAALSVFAGVGAVSLFRRQPAVSSNVHSGSPGYRKSPSGQSLHWQQKALTIYLDDSLTHVDPGASDAVMQAFGHWVESDPRLPNLSFDTGKTSPTPTRDGKSTVSYGRITTAGHEHDLAITVSYSNDKTGEIIEADIILNSLYPLGVLTNKSSAAGTTTTGSTSAGITNNNSGSNSASNSGPSTGNENSGSLARDEVEDCRNRYDVQNVTTHEAGHFFGLGEDPLERNATMFQTVGQCETHKRLLATTDVSALTTLYQTNEDPEEAAAVAATQSHACSLGRAPSSGAGAWASVLFLGLLLVRRRR